MRWKLHELDEEVGADRDVARRRARPASSRRRRRDLGDAFTSISSSRRRPLPIDLIAQGISVSPRLAFELGALGEAERIGIVVLVAEAFAIGVDLAIRASRPPPPRDAEAPEPFQHDLKRPSSSSSPLRCGPMHPISNKAGASSCLGLDHGDEAVARQRVAHHRAVTRLEDVERQRARGKRSAPASGKTGTGAAPPAHQPNGSRTAPPLLRGPGILEPDRLDELKEALPCAPSFHSRSRAMLSSSSPAARRVAACHQGGSQLVTGPMIAGIAAMRRR